MHMITIIIKPFKLDDLRETLSELGVRGMTVSEVRGFGRQKGHTEMYRGTEYKIDFVSKVKVDIAVDDERIDEIVEAAKKSAATGSVGDGKIFITPLESCTRIRTGEIGSDAL